MTIRVTCSGCGSTLKIKDELADTDGSCPKCKTGFHIPEAQTATAEARQGDGAVESPNTADADEDDMFGKDFFKIQEVSSRPKYSMPTFDDDEVEESPKPKESKQPDSDASGKQKDATPAPSANSAANMAGQLLSKTGKKNRSSDWEESQPAVEKTDYTEVKYLLTRKILPLGAGVIVAVILVYLMMDSMLAGKSIKPVLGHVRGVCTIDGKPVGGADIRFFPIAKNPTEPVFGSFSSAISEPDGTYNLRYDSENEGAVVGKHRVSVTYQGRMLEQELEVSAGPNEKALKF